MPNLPLEPVLFLKMTAENIFIVVADNLEIERICEVNLGIPSENCSQMDDGNHTEIQVFTNLFYNLYNLFF